MCLPNENHPPNGTDTEIPEEAYKPKPDLTETYLHSKRVGNYLIGRKLGAGSFAEVREAMHVVTGERVAVKIVSKETAKADDYVSKNMRREGRILQLIRHSNVVQLLELMETENAYYLVQELCQGGDLMAHLAKRRRLTEAETRRFVRQIVQAVDYMHSMGVLHRDLKIENLLLTRDQNLKIIDFGLSNMVLAVPGENGNIIINQLCRTQCGSPAYAAPEILARKAYGTAVDVWSIGVNMFAMLTGILPFTVKPYSLKALHQKMVKQEFNPLPRSLSASCRDLIMRLLNPQPETRIKLRDVMSHPWLNENVSRLRPSPFPNMATREDLRVEILLLVSKLLTVPACDVTRKVLDNNPSPCLSTYHLLAKKVDRYWSLNPISKVQSADTQEAQNDSPVVPEAIDNSPVDGESCNSSSNKEAPIAVSPQIQHHLPRRQRTFAGSVPVSAESAETTALVRLRTGVRSGTSSEGSNQTDKAAAPVLPRCPRLHSVGTCHTAREHSQCAPSATPLRPLRPDGGRSSIQSLVTQRYARSLTGRRTALTRAAPDTERAGGSGAKPLVTPLMGANFKDAATAAAAKSRQQRRFASAAYRMVGETSSNPFGGQR